MQIQITLNFNIMNKNNFFNFRQKNSWDIGWPISPRKYFLFIGLPIILFFLFFLFSCKQEPIEKLPIETYYIQLKLVDGSFKYVTYELYQGTRLEIDSKDGGYGLRIDPRDLLDKRKYQYGIVRKGDGFITMGVIDFKIDSIK